MICLLWISIAFCFGLIVGGLLGKSSQMAENEKE